eukprot:TRINITY_DN1783_c0_g1_i6.p2 TRINITY_DN1783_c0_g1~~TRINITY_DN1783_c0_g1_i6.p2  ORF type:complete len:109 (-),score=25.52 TRINITY_DN1783_c0_g1_i6:318-644(-)
MANGSLSRFFSQLLLDGGVPLVHKLAQRREVNLVQRHHQQQELRRDRRQRQVEVEQGRLLHLLGHSHARRRRRCCGCSSNQRGSGSYGPKDPVLDVGIRNLMMMMGFG